MLNPPILIQSLLIKIYQICLNCKGFSSRFLQGPEAGQGAAHAARPALLRLFPDIERRAAQASRLLCIFPL